MDLPWFARSLNSSTARRPPCYSEPIWCGHPGDVVIWQISCYFIEWWSFGQGEGDDNRPTVVTVNNRPICDKEEQTSTPETQWNGYHNFPIISLFACSMSIRPSGWHGVAVPHISVGLFPLPPEQSPSPSGEISAELLDEFIGTRNNT